MRSSQRSARRLAKILALGMLIGASTGNCAEVTIIFKDTGNTVVCSDAELKNGKMRCTTDDKVFIYPENTIKEILHKETKIYPYPGRMDIAVSDLPSIHCDHLLQKIQGPLILEKDEHTYLIVGKMYENGICSQVDIEKAKYFYRKAGNDGRTAYQELLARSAPVAEKPIPARNI